MNTPRPLPLSACFIARDEADRLPAALKAIVGLCSDIVVVVDPRSADATAAVAAQHGAPGQVRVLLRTWSGFGEQKHFAESNAAHDWILSLDADEVVTPALAAEIRALFAGTPAHNFYRLKIVEVYPGRTQPRLWAETTNVVRLFNRRRGMTSTHAVHDRAVVPPGEPIGQLHGIVLHYSVRSLAHLRAKYDAYTTLQAATLKKKPRWLLALRLVTEYPMAFAQYYIGQRHFTGGRTGLAIAHIKAHARWNRIKKMCGSK